MLHTSTPTVKTSKNALDGGFFYKSPQLTMAIDNFF